MNIIATSRKFKPTELYHLTKDPAVEKLSKHVEETLEVTGYCVYEDVNSKTGEVQTLLAIELAEGEPVATNSPTVTRSFQDIIDIFAGSEIDQPFPFSIYVFSKTAVGSGRSYINIRLVDEE